MSQRPFRLRVDDCDAPVGVGRRPYFGWLIDDSRAAQAQIAYQIQVTTMHDVLMWDSNKVAGAGQNHIDYIGQPLRSATRYRWRVRTWDGADQVGAWSDSAVFTTGLFHNDDWHGAQWIKRDNDDLDDYTCLRKSFLLQGGDVQQALLCVAAVHQYEVILNGMQIGRSSGYHYPQFQYYNAFDITGHLRPDAEKDLAVLTHWFGGGQGRPAGTRGLLLKAIITHADGHTVTVGTDASWQCHRAAQWLPDQPARHAHEGVGYVEAIRAASTARSTSLRYFDCAQHKFAIDEEWQPVTVIGSPPTPPWTGELRPDLTRIVEGEIEPARVWQTAVGRTLVDLGAIYAGRPKIIFNGRGKASLLAGYTLNADDTINLFHNQGTDMRYFAYGVGGEFVFLPQEMLGLRYLEIVCEEGISAEKIAFLVRHTELDASRSCFDSSNATLNQVWHFLKRSILVGAQEQFLDTPTREKGGFLVDSLNESLVAMAAYGERKLTRRTLHEFLDSQTQYWPDGRLNAVYPNGDGARDIPDFTQAYLVWVWHYYMQTGDAAFLHDKYDQLKAVAAYVYRHHNTITGLIHDLTGGDAGGAYKHGIIDWPPTMRYGYDMDTSARTVINAYAYADFDIIARIAQVIGYEEDCQTYRRRAHDLQAAINQNLLTPDGIYCDGLRADGTPSGHASQQANSFPLALGIVPVAHQAAVYQHIKSLKMSSGMPTVYYLIRAVGEMGDGDHLLDLYTRSDWDGWANNMAKGATCTWEGWDSDTIAAQSMSHPWGAIGLLGLQEYVLGVQARAPQFARVQIKPLNFGRRLTHAGGKVPTERGEIEVAWERANGRYILTLTLPPNMQAAVYLPTATSYTFMGEVGSGMHQFTGD